MKKVIYILITILFIAGCTSSIKKYDKEFRDYLKETYNLNLNEKSYVNKCHTNCDYYGFYTIDKDYNYAVQIEKKGSDFEVSYDEDAVKKRTQLYEYIKSIRGNDIAPNYLGFYKNFGSGIVRYTTESQQLYYIVKYNNSMNLDEELKKDYDILKKAQEIIGNSYIKEMYVLYIQDEKLNDEDWVEKLNINDDGDHAMIIYETDKYLNKFKYSYRISNYEMDTPLASLSYTEFENLVKSKLEQN